MAAASVIPVFLCLFACWIRVYSQNVCSETVNEGQVARMTFVTNISPANITHLYLVRKNEPTINLLTCHPNSTTWTCVPVDIHFTSRGPQNDGTLTVEVRDVTKIFGGQYTLKGFQTGGDFQPVTCSLTVNIGGARQTTPAPTEVADSEDSSETSTNAASIVIPIVIICLVVVGILACVLLFKFVPKFAAMVRNLCACCPCWKNQRKAEPKVVEEGRAGQETVPLVQETPKKKEDNGRGAEQTSSRPGSASAPNGDKNGGENNAPKARPKAEATPHTPSTQQPPPPAETPQATGATPAGATPSTQPAQSPAAAADIKPEDISRQETEKRLLSSDQKDGAFIIRQSQGKAKAVAIAVRRSSTLVTHHLIERENGRYKLVINQNGKPSILLFDTLSKLKNEVSNAEGLFDLERFRDESSTSVMSP